MFSYSIYPSSCNIHCIPSNQICCRRIWIPLFDWLTWLTLLKPKVARTWKSTVPLGLQPRAINHITSWYNKYLYHWGMVFIQNTKLRPKLLQWSSSNHKCLLMVQLRTWTSNLVMHGNLNTDIYYVSQLLYNGRQCIGRWFCQRLWWPLTIKNLLQLSSPLLSPKSSPWSSPESWVQVL